MIELLFSVDDINLYNSLFRLILGFIAGGIIGINRERINRAAGFRTHILICLGSCLLMLISIYIPQEFLKFKGGDPGRIASQVVTGIGFLGAGAIIKLGDHVKGLTTAASIWVSAAIGMAIGAGMFWVALAATFLVLFALIIMERLERTFFKKNFFKTLNIQLKQPIINLLPVETVLQQYNVKYEIQEYRQNTYMGLINTEIAITVPVQFPMEEFINTLTAIPNLQEISVKSKM